MRLLFTALAPGICEAPRMLSFSRWVNSRRGSGSPVPQPVNPNTMAASVNTVLCSRRFASDQVGVFAVGAPARGLNRIANSTNTNAAPAAGTSQIAYQSWVTLRHSLAAAAASVHAGFGVA